MNVRSAAPPNPIPGDDRTTTARIRDAALACFAQDGFRTTSIRAVAERAGVSPALVMHHFRSKAGLRQACDAFVVGYLRTRKREALRAGPSIDPWSLVRPEDDRLPLLAYLARALREPSEAVVALVDELVADTAANLAAGVEAGTVRALDDPRGVAAVLTLWSLGALTLHEHVRRLLGADLTGPMSSIANQRGYTLPAMEVLGYGVVAPAMAERMRAATAAWAGATDTPGGAPPGSPAAPTEEDA